jgi:hypothetical protein
MQMWPAKRDFNFTVEEWHEGKPIAVHAGADSISVARLAYEAVKRELPQRLIALCERARVIERSDEDGC